MGGAARRAGTGPGCGRERLLGLSGVVVPQPRAEPPLEGMGMLMAMFPQDLRHPGAGRLVLSGAIRHHLSVARQRVGVRPDLFER